MRPPTEAESEALEQFAQVAGEYVSAVTLLLGLMQKETDKLKERVTRLERLSIGIVPE